MIIVFCGAAGSGKTTAAQKLSKQNGAVLYSYDKFKEGSSARELPLMRSRMYHAILADAENGHDIIIDDLNITKKQRITVLKELSDLSCKKTLIIMNTSLGECLERNKKRSYLTRLPDDSVVNIYNLYEPPTLDEGWDEIIYY